MNWTHSQLNEPLTQMYRIDRNPTYFLLDKEGKLSPMQGAQAKTCIK